MPYIKEERRVALDYGNDLPKSAGELNYLLTKVALSYYENNLRPNNGGYCVMNTVMGAFESAKAEFYRRVVAPYEDEKIAQNGDVYPGDAMGMRPSRPPEFPVPPVQRTQLTQAEELYCGDDVTGAQPDRPDMGYHFADSYNEVF